MINCSFEINRKIQNTYTLYTWTSFGEGRHSHRQVGDMSHSMTPRTLQCVFCLYRNTSLWL